MSAVDEFSDFEEDTMPVNDLGSIEDSLFDDELGNMGIDDLGGGVPPMEKHSDLLKSLTNFDKFLKDMVNGWLGLYWDEEQNKMVRDPSVKPIMNIQGARWCVDFLKPYTRDNNIITNISEDHYKFIMMDVIEAIWLNIGTRSEEFGITSNGDILKICDAIEHSIALVLMGAGDGKYNDLLSTVTNRSEHVNMNGQPQYGGMQQMAPGMMNGMGMSQPMQQNTGLFKNIKNRLLGK